MKELTKERFELIKSQKFMFTQLITDPPFHTEGKIGEQALIDFKGKLYDILYTKDLKGYSRNERYPDMRSVIKDLQYKEYMSLVNEIVKKYEHRKVNLNIE